MSAVNQVPLTPLSLLERTARVFPRRVATVYEGQRRTFAEFQARVARLANGLRALGLSAEGKVAVLAPNLPVVLEAHFAIPWAGGVIVAVNTRLATPEVGYILEHSAAEVLLVDRGLLGVVRPLLEKRHALKAVIVHEDPAAGPDDGWRPPGALEYETLLAGADDTVAPIPVADERQTIAINYTSGTTGSPKGVMYSHRGALLNAVSDCLQHGLSARTVYLWTLPMFHCNGWSFSWGAPGIGATSVCLRQVEPRKVRALIQQEGVTLFCGAPIVLQMLASLAESEPFRFERPVKAGTGGAPPSPTLLAAMQALNVEVTHLYGLTETYGPSTLCEVQDEWLRLPVQEYAQQVARQGVKHQMVSEMAVLDEAHRPVPPDAATMGELCFRGNTVMLGYYRDEAATAHAFRGGWFHSGDLAVLHPDGYVEIRDRAKDIIISGGENISTIEVENVLAAHPDIEEAAVVSRPDARWGEVPVAFVKPKQGKRLGEEDVISFCRERLAHFKCPHAVYFEPLPRTSTGKVQKFTLRERMWEGQASRVKG
jgi:fatty-acyl-CoA synthase